MITSSEFHIDPVCGMAVEPTTAWQLEWDGRVYQFCDVACRDIFRDDPIRWVEPMHHAELPPA